MKLRSLLVPGALFALGVFASSCGTTFQSASYVDALAVLAIQSSEPLAKPGTTANFTMLYYDGSPRALLPNGSRRTVQIEWFGGCVNPSGDAFYGCYDSVHLEDVPGVTSVRGSGPTFSVAIPADIISSRPKTAGRSLPYGLAFVFYAVCGGKLVEKASATQSDPPLACVDEQGADVDPADYVFGYYPLYVYDKLTSTNPIVDTGTFNMLPAGGVCNADTDCSNGEHCGSTHLCLPVVPHCAAHDVKDCTKYIFTPVVEKSSVEEDQISTALQGMSVNESLDVNYYATEGTIADRTKNINDPYVGFANDYSTSWTAPSAGPGEARLFAVVRNNRGGVSWRYQDVFVE